MRGGDLGRAAPNSASGPRCVREADQPAGVDRALAMAVHLAGEAEQTAGADPVDVLRLRPGRGACLDPQSRAGRAAGCDVGGEGGIDLRLDHRDDVIVVRSEHAAVRRILAASASTGAGSIQWNDCAQVTMSADAVADPGLVGVALDVPHVRHLGRGPRPAPPSRALASTPITCTARPPKPASTAPSRSPDRRPAAAARRRRGSSAPRARPAGGAETGRSPAQTPRPRTRSARSAVARSRSPSAMVPAPAGLESAPTWPSTESPTGATFRRW